MKTKINKTQEQEKKQRANKCSEEIAKTLKKYDCKMDPFLITKGQGFTFGLEITANVHT